MFGSRRHAPTGAFALGKFPGHPEFLRAPDELGGALDEWLDAGWNLSQALPGADWSTAFAAGAAYGFVWVPPGKPDQVACGVIAPSHDSLGRPYPFIVASPLSAQVLAASWPFLPIAASASLEQSYALMTEVAAGTADDLARGLVDVRGPTAEDCAAAQGEHATWCQEIAAVSAWDAILNGGGGLRAADAATGGLEEALRPVISRERPSASVLLRMPLSGGGANAATLWLDVVRRIGRWKQMLPSMFWSVESETLLVTLAHPAPNLMGELWRPNPNDDTVFDLGTISDQGGAVSGQEAKLGHQPDATMSEFLQGLGG
jgi:type VI secretion system ImpM family protein